MVCPAGNQDQAREERGEGPRTTGKEGEKTRKEGEETEETSASEKRLQLDRGVSQGRRFLSSKHLYICTQHSKNDRIFLVDTKYLMITELEPNTQHMCSDSSMFV